MGTTHLIFSSFFLCGWKFHSYCWTQKYWIWLSAIAKTMESGRSFWTYLVNRKHTKSVASVCDFSQKQSDFTYNRDIFYQKIVTWLQAKFMENFSVYKKKGKTAQWLPSDNNSHHIPHKAMKWINLEQEIFICSNFHLYVSIAYHHCLFYSYFISGSRCQSVSI